MAVERLERGEELGIWCNVYFWVGSPGSSMWVMKQPEQFKPGTLDNLLLTLFYSSKYATVHHIFLAP